jgi:hypothetical protein
MPPDGFEVREAHRDSNAPQLGAYLLRTGVYLVARLTQLT